MKKNNHQTGRKPVGEDSQVTNYTHVDAHAYYVCSRRNCNCQASTAANALLMTYYCGHVVFSFIFSKWDIIPFRSRWGGWLGHRWLFHLFPGSVIQGQLYIPSGPLYMNPRVFSSSLLHYLKHVCFDCIFLNDLFSLYIFRYSLN